MTACVLVLHRVVERPDRDHDLGHATFQLLLRLIEESERPVAVDLLAPPPESVLLTFDDATADHLPVARALATAGRSAIFFVPTGRLGHDGHLSRDDVRTVEELGHRVGSHTVTHRRLDTLARDELRVELVESKAALDELLQAPVTYFAAPGGSWHRKLADELRLAGYEAARTTTWGLDRGQDRFRVPALPVTEATVRNGWIGSALESGRMPNGMRWAAAARRALPAGAARRARRRLHARYR